VTVFPCGTQVYVRNCGIESTITAIEIRYELVRYECTYYVESLQQRIWVHSSELMESKAKMQIGFKEKK